MDSTYNLQYWRNNKGNAFLLQKSSPHKPIDREVNEHLKKLSTRFLNVYQQSFAAKNYGLDQLTGMGLRKALEFLVKDYLIKIKHEDEQQIKNLSLMPCINKLDERTQTAAKRTAWLGNDETHYERIYTDQDIGDLINLLDITITLISHEIMLQKYEDEMPDK